MGVMLATKNVAFLSAVILCLFVFFVGATEQSESEVTPTSLKYRSGNADEECSCGEHGTCSFKQGVKTCDCFPDYGDKNGICTACTCSLPLVDDQKLKLQCTFENGVEICKCPEGWKNENSKCIDIDECLDPTSCPNDTRCENQPGTYLCFCKAGYEGINGDPKKFGCQDIDECKYAGCSLSKDSTTCVNTDGGFYCKCNPGYSEKGRSMDTIKLLGCVKDGLGVGYIILIAVVVVAAVGVVAFVVKRKFFK